MCAVLQFTVKGARALLAPLHKEKAAVRQRWRNPQGKTPRGSMIKLSPSARESLSVWKRILSRDCPPSAQLFVFADGSMDFWDTDTFLSPWALPVPRGDQRVLELTTDASSVGGGGVIDPVSAPVSTSALVWSIAQLRRLAVFESTRLRRGCFSRQLMVACVTTQRSRSCGLTTRAQCRHPRS